MQFYRVEIHCLNLDSTDESNEDRYSEKSLAFKKLINYKIPGNLNCRGLLDLMIV